MPRNTLTANVLSAKVKEPPPQIHNGTGTTIEATSRTDMRITTISCYAEVIHELHLPSEVVDTSDFFEGTISGKTGNKVSTPNTDVMSVVHRGNDYVTVYLPQTVMSRYELRDLLQEHGWHLKGLAVCSHEGAMVREEIWTQHVHVH